MSALNINKEKKNHHEYCGGKMSAIYDYGERKRKKGYKIGYKKFAKYMIKEGKTNEEIQKETELSLEEIEKIREEI